MNRKKYTGMVGAAAVIALTLAACNGNGDTNGSEDAGNGNSGSDDGPATLTIIDNAIAGGKNAAEAEWIENWVIPNFESAMADEGRDVTVEFEAQGVDDEDYKTKIALDLQAGGGADVIAMDGIWVGEFAEAQYIEPLETVAGSEVADWEGWSQIPDAVQNAVAFEDERYGVPQGADGRVWYYNKELFAEAGLPEEWEPTSWDDILEAGRALQELDGVIPIQLNAGVPMGEATTMQGMLPMLAGTGAEVWSDGQWLGAAPELGEVLDLYRTIYVEEELGDPILQQEAAGRDTSFELFAAGEIGMLLEGDYFWRAVVNPDDGTAPMENRDDVVGYTKIPAQGPGAGVNGQDHVSMSGGTGRVLNPNSEHPELAWELLSFMASQEAFEAHAEGTIRITPREDVNETLLEGEEMLQFISDEVLPVTSYRPGLAAYPEVSVALQEASAAVVSGTSVEDALAEYGQTVSGIVGDENVSNG